MCRLSYIPRPADWTKEELHELFTFLDNAAGGDGIGVGWRTSSGLEVHKGVDLTPGDAATLVAESNSLNGVLFHTRIPSVGIKCDELCMPFKIADHSLYVYNGTWGDWRNAYYSLLGQGVKLPPPPHVSDALVAAEFLSHWGVEYVTLMDKGVSVVLGPSEVLLEKAYFGDFGVARDGDRTIFASEFPKSWVKQYNVRMIGRQSKLNLAEELPDDCYKAATPHYSPQSSRAVAQNLGGVLSARHVAPTASKRSKSKKKPEINTSSATSGSPLVLKNRLRILMRYLSPEGGNFLALEWADVVDMAALPAYEYNSTRPLYAVEGRIEGTDEHLTGIGVIPASSDHITIICLIEDIEAGYAMFYQKNESETIWFRDERWGIPVWVDVGNRANFLWQQKNWWTAKLAVIQTFLVRDDVRLLEIIDDRLMARVSHKIASPRVAVSIYALGMDGSQAAQWEQWSLLTERRSPYAVEVKSKIYYEEGGRRVYLCNFAKRGRRAKVEQNRKALPPPPAMLDDGALPGLWECAGCSWVTPLIPEECPVCGEKTFTSYIPEVGPGSIIQRLDWAGLRRLADTLNRYRGKFPSVNVQPGNAYVCLECGSAIAGYPTSICTECGGDAFIPEKDVHPEGISQDAVVIVS